MTKHVRGWEWDYQEGGDFLSVKDCEEPELGDVWLGEDEEARQDVRILLLTVDVLDESGALVLCEALPHLREVIFCVKNAFSAEAMRVFRKLPQLEKVTFGEMGKLTSKILEEVAGLSALKEVVLESIKAREDFLSSLATWQQVERLSLGFSSLPGSCLGFLSKMSSLKELSMEVSKDTDGAAFLSMGDLRGLEAFSLFFSGAPASESEEVLGFVSWEVFCSARTLVLSGWMFSSQVMAGLRVFRALESLRFEGCRLPSETLKIVGEFVHLQELGFVESLLVDLSFEKVSTSKQVDAQLVALSAALDWSPLSELKKLASFTLCWGVYSPSLREMLVRLPKAKIVSLELLKNATQEDIRELSEALGKDVELSVTLEVQEKPPSGLMMTIFFVGLGLGIAVLLRLLWPEVSKFRAFSLGFLGASSVWIFGREGIANWLAGGREKTS
ncbi:MAG: hypothetical protein H6728_01855 [Myxococcales bacterium]|nr:hypothetical protein [Myxococcales bacterium]MCB9641796.1 hypothetical protein [Myxococcales bacterium]